MALGGIILYLVQNLGMGTFVTGSSGAAPFLSFGSDYSVEARVRFPGPTNTLMPPTDLSGALITLSSGSTATAPAVWGLWYEKPSPTATTGNLYVTSSAGRLTLASASIFNDNFYNVSVVHERTTGSFKIVVLGYEDGEQTLSTSSIAWSGSAGYPTDSSYARLELGSSILSPSAGQFWAHEMRLWSGALAMDELSAHSAHFESYGRDVSYNNSTLLIHWRLGEGGSSDGAGKIYPLDSTLNYNVGTGSNFIASSVPYDKFLVDYAYIPSIEYGWNQSKVRVFSGSSVDPFEAYEDENLVALEFNMYDALNEDISHLMTSYDELNNFIGLPVNRFRPDYEGLRQMRETYFKRLQGQLNLRTFVGMLDFFDTSFVKVVERLLPARALFKGDEIVVESHMLERPKYQYGLRPIHEGIVDVSGCLSIVDRNEDW